jgi:hypothetical protein
MTEGQEHKWHIELDYLLCKVRHAVQILNESNLQTLSDSYAIKELEPVISSLQELCELTKGESK